MGMARHMAKLLERRKKSPGLCEDIPERILKKRFPSFSMFGYDKPN
jgi:hypothetical protein